MGVDPKVHEAIVNNKSRHCYNSFPELAKVIFFLAKDMVKVYLDEVA